MLTMDQFSEIITLRNKGISQAEIAKQLGVSRRSIIRYLKTGQIPCYKRVIKSNRQDPMEGFYDLAKNKIESAGEFFYDDYQAHGESCKTNES